MMQRSKSCTHASCVCPRKRHWQEHSMLGLGTGCWTVQTAFAFAGPPLEQPLSARKAARSLSMTAQNVGTGAQDAEA